MLCQAFFSGRQSVSIGKRISQEQEEEQPKNRMQESNARYGLDHFRTILGPFSPFSTSNNNWLAVITNGQDKPHAE
jgi:hypothetical protein